MTTTTTTTTTAPTHTDPAVATVANRLVELCSAGKFTEALRELYADDARHVEAMEMPGSDCKRITEGKAALLKLADAWDKTTTVHSSSCGKALINGDQFVCEMGMDVTAGEGPMAGQRMKVSETCLYTVKNGKIVEAKFFYSCDM